MLKMQLIEDRLIKIDAATFQELCDRYIYYTEPTCDSVIRSGNTIAKRVTRKGTPDAYYVLPSGKYVLLEYTIMNGKEKAALLKKMKEDVDKCVALTDENFTLEKIDHLIYCLTSRMDLKDREDLLTYAGAKGLLVTIKDLDILVTGLLNNTPNLARDYLDLAIDTGQVLSLKEFVEQYEHSGIATPLNNTFVGRETELTSLLTAVQNAKVTILTGAPGVGKTKLVVQLFKTLASEDTRVKCYCILNKHVPIFDNLQDLIVKDQDYYFFIDDANRQVDLLRTLLGILSTESKKKIRLILTVRDYALPMITAYTESYNPEQIVIEKLNYEQLKSILLTPELNIRSEVFQKRILEIADGNPRLAIMAARIAIDQQTLESIQDASAIYDRYYSGVLPGDFFKDKMMLRVLAVLAFFNTIDRRNKEAMENLLPVFSIEQEVFDEKVTELETLELVEQSPGLQVIKIGEQVLGTYFFYYVFFKEQLLDFTLILTHYLKSHHRRIQESIVPANNTIGFKTFSGLIDPYITRCWEEVKENAETALVFFDLFWIYKQDTLLWYIDRYIESLPVPDNPAFIIDKGKTSANSINNDPYLELLSHLYRQSFKLLPDALDLGWTYVYRKPELYTEFVKRLTEIFMISWEDELMEFDRLENFISFLGKQDQDRPASYKASLLFDTIPALMRSVYTVFDKVSGSGRAYSLTQYHVPLNKKMKAIRSNVWQLVEQQVADNEARVFSLFYTYLTGLSYRENEKVNQYDFGAILKTIKTHFRPDNFKAAFIINEMNGKRRRRSIRLKDMTELKKCFNNLSYQYYVMLSYDIWRDSSRGDRLKYEKYQQRKEIIIRENLPFKDMASFVTFYESCVNTNAALLSFGKKDMLKFGLDIVFDESFKRDKATVTYLQHIATTGNKTGYVPHRLLQPLSEDINAYFALYRFLKAQSFFMSDWWFVNWFVFLPPGQLTRELVEAYLDLIYNSTELGIVYFSDKEKYNELMPGFYTRQLKAVYEHNLKQNVKKIELLDTFTHHLQKFTSDVPLIKKVYLQQEESSQNYDHDFEEFFEILKLDNSFLVEYLKKRNNGGYFSVSAYEGLSVVWEHIPDAEPLVAAAMDYLCENSMYHIDTDACTVFFKETPTEKIPSRVTFLKEYLRKNANDVAKVKAVFDCIRNCYREHTADTLKYFLSIQPDVEIFKQIRWSSNFMLMPARSITGDIRANQYQGILTILDGMEKSYQFAPHKEWIKQNIVREKKYAEQERIRSFFERD